MVETKSAIKNSVSVKTAREIFGKKFIDAEQAVSLLDIRKTDPSIDLAFSGKAIQCPEETLRNLANSHFLAAGIPLSILDTHRVFTECHYLFEDDPW